MVAGFLVALIGPRAKLCCDGGLELADSFSLSLLGGGISSVFAKGLLVMAGFAGTVLTGGGGLPTPLRL
jgi:hypothetical protein